jgi:hypothetical protein
MAWKLNVFTGTLDITLSHTNLNNLLDSDYLKLDQTVPQRVINDAPHFDKGLIIRAGEKLYFDGD